MRCIAWMWLLCWTDQRFMVDDQIGGFALLQGPSGGLAVCTGVPSDHVQPPIGLAWPEQSVSLVIVTAVPVDGGGSWL
jgi:hypothetical protein